jgi:hypothetical protein
MADGEARPDDGIEAVAGAGEGEGATPEGWLARFNTSRQAGFISFALAAFLGWCAAIEATAYLKLGTPNPLAIISETDLPLWFAAASVLFWMPLMLLLRDSRDNFAHGPSLRLPVACLTLLVCLAGGLASVEQWGHDLLGIQPEGLFTSPFLACVFATLALIFVPLAWNAANLARFQAEAREKAAAARTNLDGMADSQDAEAMGALVATLFVGGIIAFAICAGIFNEDVSFDNLVGVIIGFVVIGAFAIVVFLEPLSDLPPVKLLTRMFGSGAKAARPLAAFYDMVDTFLVRIVAVMSGMEHRTLAARYGILITMLVSLCLLGWYLPPQWGLIPCALGIVAAVSVSRLWSWVEDDRALAALTDFKPTTPYRTAMREDYRDETLLGFLFVFFLIPIMMRDAHSSQLFGHDMFTLPKGEAQTHFLDWFGFFGITLAKAVPIVDWAEIYNFGQTKNGSQIIDFQNSIAARHAVFMARSTVDLVLIASLLQAISISGRNRQQKRLYKAGTDPANKYRPGLIDRLDTFVEKAELRRAMMECLNRKAPWPEKRTTPQQAHDLHFDLKILSQRPGLVDFRRYNADRLGQMHGEYKDPVARAFIAAISVERPDFDLTPRLVLLDGMAERGAPESDLYTMLDRIEVDLADTPGAVNLTIEVLRSILFHTAKRAGLREFKERVIDLMTRCTPAEEVIDALADVAGRSNPDAYQYTRKAAVEAIVVVAQGKDGRAGPAARGGLKDVLQSEPGPTTTTAIRHALKALDDLLKP